VSVIKTEEKESDVNLATYLLVDAFRNDTNTFVVVSNDSDLMEPLRIVRRDLGKLIGLVNLHTMPSRALAQCQPHFMRQLRRGVISNSQFPPTVTASNRTQLHIPAFWQSSLTRLGLRRERAKKQKPRRGGASQHRASLSSRMKPLQAAIAVGHRAHRLAFALMRNQQPYDPARLAESVATGGERRSKRRAGPSTNDREAACRHDVTHPPTSTLPRPSRTRKTPART